MILGSAKIVKQMEQVTYEGSTFPLLMYRDSLSQQPLGLGSIIWQEFDSSFPICSIHIVRAQDCFLIILQKFWYLKFILGLTFIALAEFVKLLNHTPSE